MTLATLAPPDTAPPCAGADVDGFFRRRYESASDARQRLTQTARDYCAHCPIQNACAETADMLRAEGLWGGILRRRHHHGGVTTRNLLCDDEQES